ncbi:MAG: GGDEF domain-containing protein [Deltaproteobacteria bacterium]|nr:GGDEF domain-containing protein [Deltaproteobacteria bacterium]
MVHRLMDQVREFWTAALRLNSYNPWRNPYIWFGILWGLPVPVVTAYLEIILTEPNQPAPHILAHIFQSPRQCFFLAHPLLFGALFGILGTIRHDKDTQINNLIAELQRLSTLDPLTGLANRRHFMNVFHDEIARADRQTLTLSIVFLDLDFFKKINDTYGHHMGDKVIREASRFIETHCRPYDTIARWGGEEYVILLPSSDEKEAALFAERIRAGIAAGFSPEIPFPLTVSAGIAQYQPGDTLSVLVDRADQALYAAKLSGRNRVMVSSALP